MFYILFVNFLYFNSNLNNGLKNIIFLNYYSNLRILLIFILKVVNLFYLSFINKKYFYLFFLVKIRFLAFIKRYFAF